MQVKLLQLIVCPKCLGKLTCDTENLGPDDDIKSGTLNCAGCQRVYSIVRGIPRFVTTDNYASSFGYQWNTFKGEQVDSINGTKLSTNRFYKETKWSPEWMRGKWILDAGCGAGRFLDVASHNDCEVVGVDITNSTDAARHTLGNRRNVHLVQASIYELPFRSGMFDACYCIGVIQHTPSPTRALRSLPRILKENGRLAVTIYERKKWTLLNTKYVIRPLTKRLNQKLLMNVIKMLMPFLFPLTEVLFRIPYLGRFFKFTIPVANYVNEPQLTLRQRYRWAVMDTFDMLAPQFDQPQTEEEATKTLIAAGLVHIERLKNPGLNLTGLKGTSSADSSNHN